MSVTVVGVGVGEKKEAANVEEGGWALVPSRGDLGDGSISGTRFLMGWWIWDNLSIKGRCGSLDASFRSAVGVPRRWLANV